MKNLKNYTVKVRNTRERDIAVVFYKRATKRGMALRNSSNFPAYVGMGNQKGFGSETTNLRWVTVGDFTFDHEKTLDFRDIRLLADTDNRVKILNDMFPRSKS